MILTTFALAFCAAGAFIAALAGLVAAEQNAGRDAGREPDAI